MTSIKADKDGFEITASNHGKIYKWRLDKSMENGCYVMYRSDQKPTSRRHYSVDVEGDVYEWWLENSDKFEEYVNES